MLRDLLGTAAVEECATSLRLCAVRAEGISCFGMLCDGQDSAATHVPSPPAGQLQNILAWHMHLGRARRVSAATMILDPPAAASPLFASPGCRTAIECGIGCVVHSITRPNNALEDRNPALCWGPPSQVSDTPAGHSLWPMPRRCALIHSQSQRSQAQGQGQRP